MTCVRCGLRIERLHDDPMRCINSLRGRIDDLEEALRRIAYPDVNGDQLNHDSCINVARLALEVDS